MARKARLGLMNPGMWNSQMDASVHFDVHRRSASEVLHLKVETPELAPRAYKKVLYQMPKPVRDSLLHLEMAILMCY